MSTTNDYFATTSDADITVDAMVRVGRTDVATPPRDEIVNAAVWRGSGRCREEAREEAPEQGESRCQELRSGR